MVLISIGANLPGADGASPLLTCRRAAVALDALLPGLRLSGLSRWYETAPVLPDGAAAAQPPYVNGVAQLMPAPGVAVDPAELLRCLMALEAAAGRVRSVANAPRVLDLDIVAVGDLARSAPDPILPHPRAHARAFVLVPLAEVAPGWVHPVLQRNVAALIAALPQQPLRAL